MSANQILSVLLARWWIVLLGFLASLAIAAAAIHWLPRKYTATAQVIVDLRSPELVAGIGLPPQMLPGAMATQVDIIRSDKVALQVVDRLRLAESPVAIQQFAEDGSPGSIRHYLAQLLVKGLEANPSRESSVMSISFTGADPRFAALVANEFARVYIDTNIELRVEPARSAATWFDDQTRALRADLEGSQKKLSDFQRANGIVLADERIDIETAKLQELSSQVTTLTAQTVDSAKRQAQAKELLERGGAGELPDVLANSLVQSLKSNQIQLEGKRKELGAVLGPSHPEILRLDQEIASITGRIAKETEAVANSLAKAWTLNRQREGEIRATLERQREKVLQIKQVRDELQVLQRDVDNAQRVYDTMTQRLNQKTLESQSTQANIVMLDPAVPPPAPSSPNVKKIGAIGVLFGAIAGVGLAMLLELMQRRIRNPEDLAAAVDAPVIGNIRRVKARIRRSQGWARAGA